MHLAYPAVLAALLFCVGLYGVLARRNAILVLMSVELMLNAVNLNLVAFDVWLRDTLHSGQALTLFTIAIAAAEIGIGLAIVLAVHRNRGTSDIDRLRDTAETDEAETLPDTAETDTAEISDAETAPGRTGGTTGKSKKAEATT
ncbi:MULTISPECIES: NADH-quinone oxidoreductase subunit NuoK [Streptomyces]|uniref:NADH-quinone oxidoreductase subunit K n=1 Tax=Streptomyces badius TaxID=1941 RepID=A0ABQ2T698_STRBA|nr:MULTISPECIES: NADH-quinone oxidoreductase subunit NuoK [Streptomyces]GGS53778.1 NADH-quinone oxidoreductase subunit K 1 [Streptomyces badius]